MTSFSAREKEMSIKLVECSNILSQLRGALSTIAAWSSCVSLDEEQVWTQEKLEERLEQIYEYARTSKDLGL